jgi:hypothetical protein
MGNFTVLDDPLADQIVSAHMQKIVIAVRSRMEPQAIILRGSFGRGEGSVMVQGDQLHFLSDYEIDVATGSPFYRSIFTEISNQLTTELGVETCLRWVRPNYMSTARVGPIPMGAAPATISLYESRYGSQIIYGHDVIGSGPAVNPNEIELASGVQLVLNRMAESLYYMPRTTDAEQDELKIFYWITKTILACAESLLLLWGQYHFSYEERGRRFAAMSNGRLGFIPDLEVELSELVARATEFKLHPKHGLYQKTIHETWQQVVPICASVFHHLTEQVLGFSFCNYTEYPEQYLEYQSASIKNLSPQHLLALKLLDIYKFIRQQRIPRGLLLPYDASQVVFSVVPLLFVGWAGKTDTSAALLSEARRWLNLIYPLKSPQSDYWDEWELLRTQMLRAWKNFCFY